MPIMKFVMVNLMDLYGEEELVWQKHFVNLNTKNSKGDPNDWDDDDWYPENPY